jgi:hypothetical protein
MWSGHRREHDRVGAALGDQQRDLEGAEHVIAVDLAGHEVGADRRRHGHAGGQQRLGVLRCERPGREALDQGPHGSDVGRQVVGGGVGDVVEEVATLVISVRTAGVHVSHILRKLGAPNRLEAAAIAHRLSPPPTAQVIT